jgi:hypothetical protein
MIQHTPACLARQESYRKELAAYEAKWPKYCRSCGGEGGTYWSGSRDEPPSVDVCDDCVVQEKCPRCGETVVWYNEITEENVSICPHCQWNCDRPNSLPQPDDVPCECELADIYANASSTERSEIHAAWAMAEYEPPAWLAGGDEPWTRF